MVDSNEDDKKSIAVPIDTFRMSRVTISLMIVFMVSSVGALSFSFFQWAELRKQRTISLEKNIELREVNTAFREKVKTLIQQNSKLVEGLNLRVNAMGADMAELKNQRMAMDSLYRNLSTSKLVWTLGEIEHALVITEQQLSFSGDMGVALKTLQKVRLIIDRSGIPELVELRPLIMAEIGRIKQLQSFDLLSLSERLVDISDQVGEFPLKTLVVNDDRRNDENLTEVQADQEKSFIAIVVESLGALIRIDRYTTNSSLVLDQEQEFIVKENIKVRLLLARLALFIGNREMFKNDIEMADKLIDEFFDSGSDKVNAVRNILADLNSQKYQWEKPSIQLLIDKIRSSN